MHRSHFLSGPRSVDCPPRGVKRQVYGASALIVHNGSKIHLGFFDSMHEAGVAYSRAFYALFGAAAYYEALHPVLASTPQYLELSGANRNVGSNGLYSHRGDENGRPLYVHLGDFDEKEPGRKVYWSENSTWDIYHDGDDSPESSQDSLLPPEDGCLIDQDVDNIRVRYVAAS